MTSSDAQRESWRRLLTEQQASGLSVSCWCRDHDIDKLKFYYWRKRLAPIASGASTAEPSPTRWVAVATDARPAAACGLTLRVGRIAVEVGAGFDSRVLADVLTVLEARC